MVSITLVVFLVLTATSSCRADINVDDYVYWKKADIESWHKYFPSRSNEEERLTNAEAITAISELEKGLRDSLHNIVIYQTQVLEIAKLMMEGTSAQGCVRGISPYIENSIDQEISKYCDCSADAIPKLNRVYKNQYVAYNNYMATYSRSRQGIDNCAKTYPNKDSTSRLIMCVESWYNLYFKEANNTSYNVYSSPSMSVFVKTVLPCAETAGKNMVDEGWKFLNMTVQCGKLSENPDSEYERNVMQGYSKYISDNDLRIQVGISQNIYKVEVDKTEQVMQNYYNIKKKALENYVIEPRGLVYYINIMRGYMQKYFLSVSSTGVENPASLDCVSVATNELNYLVIKASEEALESDQFIVNQTKNIFTEVTNLLLKQNEVLPSVGNVAILDCFTLGYIFADKTILDCSTLIIQGFSLNATEINKLISNYINILLDYEYSFFSSSSLPGGDKLLPNTYLGADRVLYNLQRCVYINTGSKYAVTTLPSNYDVTPTSERYNY